MVDLKYDLKKGNVEIIKYYRKVCGLNVMPLSTNGSRTPKIGWKPYMVEPVPGYLITQYFTDSISGIGVICGSTSGNLEVLDFDSIRFVEPWFNMVRARFPTLLDQAPFIATPSEGRHLYWRCDEIEGNSKLAYDKAEEIAIETRGQGGFAVMPGGPLTTHRLGKPYRLISGSFETIPRITPRQRTMLLEIARSLDLKPAKPEKINLEAVYGLPGAVSRSDMGDRPGDDFNARGAWSEILDPQGWRTVGESGDVVRWQRPGKEGSGPSATTGHCGDRLFVFSSNAHPFESGQSYTKFAAFALLWCDGNYHTAASHLARIGYGGDMVSERENSAIAIVEESIKKRENVNE